MHARQTTHNLRRRTDLTPARPPTSCQLGERAPAARSAEVRAPFAAEALQGCACRRVLLAALRRVRERPLCRSSRRVWTGCPRARRTLRLRRRSVTFFPHPHAWSACLPWRAAACGAMDSSTADGAGKPRASQVVAAALDLGPNSFVPSHGAGAAVPPNSDAQRGAARSQTPAPRPPEL